MFLKMNIFISNLIRDMFIEGLVKFLPGAVLVRLFGQREAGVHGRIMALRARAAAW